MNEPRDPQWLHPAYICPICGESVELMVHMPNIDSVAEWEGFWGNEREAICIGQWNSRYYFIHFVVKVRETAPHILADWQKKIRGWKKVGKPKGKKPQPPFRESPRLLKVLELPDELKDEFPFTIYEGLLK